MRLGIEDVLSLLSSKTGSLIITGPNGVGKTLLSIQAADRALKRGTKCVYALTTMAPRTFLDMAKFISVDFSDSLENNSLVLVDCHTRGEESSPAKFSISPEASLLQIRQTFLEAAEFSQNYLLVVDDLSTLLAYVPSETAFKFYQGVASDLRRNKATGISVIVPEILDQKLTNLLYSLSDGVVEMTLEDMGGNLRRFMRIRFMRGVKHLAEWSEFQIGEHGLEIITY
ncbi:MAG: ATPase domain-containing protein [Candidatus Caldarchaeum sp.]